jgi:hypothetical protein
MEPKVNYVTKSYSMVKLFVVFRNFVCDATKHRLCLDSSVAGTNPIRKIDFEVSYVAKSTK